jgi:ribosomal protein L18E
MTSDTVSYTNLVKLFREQARTEAEEVHKNVTELMKLPKFEGIDVSFSETVNYCKNFSRLNAITGTNLADEFKNGIRVG